MKFQLTFTPEQARVLTQALDIYSRLGLGQFEKVLDVYDPDFKLTGPVRDEIRRALEVAKEEAGHPAHGSHGIHNPVVPDTFRVAFDLQQVVRHKLAWAETPMGSPLLRFDTPRQSSQLALPTIEIIDEPAETAGQSRDEQ